MSHIFERHIYSNVTYILTSNIFQRHIYFNVNKFLAEKCNKMNVRKVTNWLTRVDRGSRNKSLKLAFQKRSIFRCVVFRFQPMTSLSSSYSLMILMKILFSPYQRSVIFRKLSHKNDRHFAFLQLPKKR